MITPAAFGISKLNYMHLNVEELDAEGSNAPTRPQVAPPQGSSSLPVDFEAKIQQIVDAAIDTWSSKINFELNKIAAQLTYTQQRFEKTIADLNEKIDTEADVANGRYVDLEAQGASLISFSGTIMDKLDKVISMVKPSTTSAGFGSPSDAPPSREQATTSSPSFQFHTPSVPTSATPVTPSTEILPPADPSPSTPATQIIDPTVPLSIATPVLHPNSFDDVKGGEEDNQD